MNKIRTIWLYLFVTQLSATLISYSFNVLLDPEISMSLSLLMLIPIMIDASALYYFAYYKRGTKWLTFWVILCGANIGYLSLTFYNTLLLGTSVAPFNYAVLFIPLYLIFIVACGYLKGTYLAAQNGVPLKAAETN